MIFRTEINLPESKHKINFKSRLMMLGSCFTENIGKRLFWHKFKILINPFGIIYNPVSVKKSLSFIIKKTEFTNIDIEHHNGLWFSFYHHSRFSHHDKNICLTNINTELQNAVDWLPLTTHLFITFGTAWVYKLKKTGKIISNCHKLPSNQFKRVLLGVDDVVNIYDALIKQISEIAPQINIVFTVSPVRHWKDGAEGNQLSKSVLILAVNELKNRFENVSYFPSYEIMMDDLRDYRFYDEDMLHPNKIAVDYIWKKFSNRYFDNKTISAISDINKTKQALAHKPFNTKTEVYQKFIEKTQQKIKLISEKYPEIDFSDEL